jgi:hypothetical protein
VARRGAVMDGGKLRGSRSCKRLKLSRFVCHEAVLRRGRLCLGTTGVLTADNMRGAAWVAERVCKLSGVLRALANALTH